MGVLCDALQYNELRFSAIINSFQFSCNIVNCNSYHRYFKQLLTQQQYSQ